MGLWGELSQKIYVSRMCSEIHANQFCGHGLSGSGDLATFQIWHNFPFKPKTIVHGGQKIESAQKIHASRGCCEMHAN